MSLVKTLAMLTHERQKEIVSNTLSGLCQGVNWCFRWSVLVFYICWTQVYLIAGSWRWTFLFTFWKIHNARCKLCMSTIASQLGNLFLHWSEYTVARFKAIVSSNLLENAIITHVSYHIYCGASSAWALDPHRNFLDAVLAKCSAPKLIAN